MSKIILLSTLSFLASIILTSNSFGFSSSVYGSGCVQGNNNVKSTQRDVPKFSVLDFSGAFTVNVVAGKSAHKVKITADKNLLSLITTDIQGNILAIYPKKSICTENDIIIDVTVGTLQALTSSGSDDIKVTGINNSKFTLLQGGAGDIELIGNAKKFEAEITGSGDLEAQNLKSETTSINLTGSSAANVHATEELEIYITGVADVNYFGNPKKVTKDILGVGDINKMD